MFAAWYAGEIVLRLGELSPPSSLQAVASFGFCAVYCWSALIAFAVSPFAS